MFDSLRRKEYISADIAYLGGDMLNDNNTVALAHSSHYFALLIFTWTICDTALHLDLLSVIF
jgi:hypothetical protein